MKKEISKPVSRLGIVVLVLLAATSAMATITNTYYVVPVNASPTSPYTNWSGAATNIQTAVNQAATDLVPGSNTCVVLVSNGVYTVSTNIVITNGITLLGMNGWSNTAVNGDGVTRCFWVSNTAAVVDGFTISNGMVNGQSGTPAGQGGGIYLAAGTLQNSLITRNRGTSPVNGSEGPGIYMKAATVRYCTIISNSAPGTSWQRGGGVCMTGNGLVEHCLIQGNVAGNGGGGGVYMNGGDILRNCLVIGNYCGDNATSYRGGGAVMGDDSVSAGRATVQNCTIVGNKGGGINRGRAKMTVQNSIVYFNVDTSGNPMNWRNVASSDANSTVLFTCTTPELLPANASNITDDPNFVNAGSGYGTNYVTGDLHLQYGSRAIDSGTNITAITNDFEGNARPLDGGGGLTNDMGAYEMSFAASPLSCAINTSVFGGLAPFTNSFSAGISGASGVTNVACYWWDFGPGTVPQSGPDKSVVTNVFAVGLYPITLIVSNTLGTVVSNTAMISVVSTNAYVATNGSALYPYNTWAKAATNIQSAINAANIAYDSGYSNPIVLVSNGVYALGTELIVSKGMTVRSVGSQGSTFIRPAPGFNKRGFYLIHPDAVVDGFTIDGFNCTQTGIDDDGSANGSGVLIVSSGSGSTLQNCTVSRCTNATTYSGAIFVKTAGRILNCLIERNKLGRAGAFYLSGTGGFVQDCVIRYNVNTDWGGAGTTMVGGTVRNCLFYGNVSTLVSSWGTIFMDGGVLENCTLTGNENGGIFMRSGGTVRNCIVYNNSYSNFYDSAGGRITYTCTTPMPVGGMSNLVANPLFMDPGAGGYGANYISGDYHLNDGSPCINTGTNQSWMTNAMDLADQPRIKNIIVDMGAYEGREPSGSIFVMR